MKKIEDINKNYFGPRMSDGAGVFVAGFVFLYIFQVVLILVAELTGIDVENAPTWFTWVMMLVNQAALVIAVAAYGGVAHKPLLQESRINRSLNYKQVLIIPVISIACIMAFLPLAEGFVRLVRLITKSPLDTDLALGSQWWEIMLSVFFVAVLPAVGEELLFRAGVARGLTRENYVFVIVMSGLLFSIFHGNAEQTVHQFLIGMVFAYLYFVTGSLLASIICHFANNALAILFSVLLSTTNKTLSVGAEVAIYVTMSIVGFVALYFLLGYIMKLSKDAKYNEKHKFQLNWLKDLGNTLKTLFDDPCDDISLNGDLDSSDSATNEVKTEQNVNENKLDKVMQEANMQTIKKRNKFDWYALLAALGISLAVWIINLFA